MRARQTRAISNIIGAVLLVVITVALAVFFYFYAHRFMNASTPSVSISASVAGESWETSGTGTLVLQVSVTNDGSAPVALTGFTIIEYTENGVTSQTTSISPSPTSSAITYASGTTTATGNGYIIPAHTTETFTLIVSGVPVNTNSIAVQATVYPPNGAPIYPTSPQLSLTSS